MTIHTTYFAALEYNHVDPADDDHVVSVVRHPQDWTEDLVDRNIEALAPPEHLLDAFKSVEDAADADDDIENASKVAWQSTRFEQRYRDHLTSSSLSNVLGTLRGREQRGDIWLVCYEKDPQYCHRRVLANEMTRGRDESPKHHPEPGIKTDTDDRVSNSRLDQFGETDGGRV